jgi:hypothetical protein
MVFAITSLVCADDTYYVVKLRDNPYGRGALELFFRGRF